MAGAYNNAKIECNADTNNRKIASRGSICNSDIIIALGTTTASAAANERGKSTITRPPDVALGERILIVLRGKNSPSTQGGQLPGN